MGKQRGILQGAIGNGLLHILTGNILTKGISMISGMVIARLVTKETYASYMYGSNLYMYISMVSGLGMGTALLKYTSSVTSPEKDRMLFSFALSRGLVFDLSLSILLCIGVWFVDVPFENAKNFIYMMALLPALRYIFSAIQIYNRAHLQNKRFSAMGIVQALITCVLGIGATLLLKSLVGMIIAQYIAVLAAIAIGLRYVQKRLRGVSPRKMERHETKAFTQMAISLVIASFFSSIIPVNEAFLVNNLIRDEVVSANFRVAGIFPEQLLLITNSLMIYYFPIVAQMRDKQAVLKQVTRIGVVTFLIIAGCTAIGMLLTPFIIQLIYGTKYADAVPLAYILWIMRALNAGIRMVPINLLPAIGKTKFNAIMSIASCIVHTVLDYVLISRIGIAGVAYASIAVYSVTGVAYWAYFVYTCKKNGIGPKTGELPK